MRIWLFALYLAIYVGFMLLTAFNLPLMASTPFGGINLAVIYGLALIGTALGLALVYIWLHRKDRGSEAPGLPPGVATGDGAKR